jgi:pimeloyl-ACP methyl ester carboxylesterase
MRVTTPAPKVAAFRRLLPIPTPPASASAPALDKDQARARLAELVALDAGIPEVTASRLLEPAGAAVATLILWHGFTNAPSQFSQVGEAFRGLGYRVLIPRMPHHGQADVLTRDLANLTTAELVAHTDACVDIAAGFGDPVWVVGLSAGGTVAAWAAANRSEIRRVVLAAPLVAPKGLPLPLVRLFVRYPKIVPNLYFWWDPRKKAKLGHSPYAYPGFPMPGILPFLHLSEALFDHSVNASHGLERVVLTTNPGDLAIRRDAALAFAEELFFPQAEVSGVAAIDGGLKWMHDFVDPWSPDAGTTEQVVAILLACLGVADPSAGGLLVPPLVVPQPSE